MAPEATTFVIGGDCKTPVTGGYRRSFSRSTRTRVRELPGSNADKCGGGGIAPELANIVTGWTEAAIPAVAIEVETKVARIY